MVERYQDDKAEQKPLRGEKQYRDFLLQSLGVSSLLLALLICWITQLPTFLAEELAFTEEEVINFAGPGARLLAKSPIPDTVKTSLVNSSDYIGLATAAIAYVYRVLSVVKQFEGKTVEYTRQTQGVPASQQSAATNGTIYNTTNHLAGFGNFTAQ